MKRIFTFFPFLYKSSLGYLAPSNLSYFWNFGSLALFAFGLEILRSLCLSWWYIPHIDLAFSSVGLIVRFALALTAWVVGSKKFIFFFVILDMLLIGSIYDDVILHVLLFFCIDPFTIILYDNNYLFWFKQVASWLERRNKK